VVVQAVNVALMHVLIGFVFYLVVLVYAIFDAYGSAEGINANHAGRAGSARSEKGRVRVIRVPGGCLFWCWSAWS
jgi:hypothetical protein